MEYVCVSALSCRVNRRFPTERQGCEGFRRGLKWETSRVSKEAIRQRIVGDACMQYKHVNMLLNITH